MTTARAFATDLVLRSSGRRSWSDLDEWGPLLIGGTASLLLVLALTWMRRASSLRRELGRRWQRIDDALAERHELVTTLIQTARRNLPSASSVPDDLAQAHTDAAVRSHRSPAARQEREIALSEAVRALFAVAEDCPQLTADPAYRDLRVRLVGCDRAIADRLPGYNELVCHRWVGPNGLLARLLRSPKVDQFQHDTPSSTARVRR